MEWATGQTLSGFYGACLRVLAKLVEGSTARGDARLRDALGDQLL